MFICLLMSGDSGRTMYHVLDTDDMAIEELNKSDITRALQNGFTIAGLSLNGDAIVPTHNIVARDKSVDIKACTLGNLVLYVYAYNHSCKASGGVVLFSPENAMFKILDSYERNWTYFNTDVYKVPQRGNELSAIVSVSCSDKNHSNESHRAELVSKIKVKLLDSGVRVQVIA